jgi:trehalose-6-phosphate synthase
VSGAARELPAAKGMNPFALRHHPDEILTAIVQDVNKERRHHDERKKGR